MPRKIILRLWCSILLLGAGAGGTKEVNGILGKSVVFKVKTSRPLETISWSTIVKNNSRIFALVTFRQPCELLFPIPAYQKRVSISKDCRELHLGHLEREDAGRYAAQIALPTSETTYEHFDLRVFRRLLDSEMKVTCTGAANGTWRLNCSTGTLEDRVQFSWSSDVQSKNPLLENSVIFTSQDFNLNVTCAAENPISNASTTVSIKKVCTEEGHPPSAWIVGMLVFMIITITAIAVSVWRKKAAKRKQFTTHAGDASGS